jgi:hypothetical protein
MNEVKIQEIKTLISDLFANDKTPSETFDMSWDMLSNIENDQPALTCKTYGKECQTA